MANDKNLSTGKTQLNSQLVAGAQNLAGPALDMAQGASALQAAGNALKNAALDKLLGPTAAFAGVLTGTLLIMRKLVRESLILEKGLVKISNLQQIQGKFETLLKSATLAKKRIEELYRFAASSPFKFEGVAEANRQLEALTYGAFSGQKAMRMVGDAAAATGQPIEETAEKVGKLYAALASGRSIDKIAFQLQFTGIATEGLLDKLEKLEQAGAGFTEMWSEVEKVLARTEGGMRNEMETLESLNTKLEESRAMMAKAFAEPFVEAQSKSLRVMTAATQNLTPVLSQVAQDIAAVKGVFIDFKTSLLDITLASPGMAKALSAAWQAAKTLWLTLAAATAINFARNIGPMLGFAKGAVDAAKASLALASASHAAATATTALTAAKTALAAGELRLAASQALTYGWFRVSSAAMAVHAAGLASVRTATGLAAASNYALGASTAVLGGAFKLAGTAARFAGAQIKSAFLAVLATPIGAFIAAVTAGTVAAFAIGRGAKAARKEFEDLADSMAATNRELTRLLDTAKTTDDWAKYMAAVTDEIAKSEQAVTDLQKKISDKSLWAKAWGYVTGQDILDEGALRIAKAQPGQLRAQRKGSLAKLPFLGMGSKESEAYARDLNQRQALSDAALENWLGQADDEARVTLLEKEAKRLDSVAAAAENVRNAYEKFDRDPAHIEASTRLVDARNTQSALRDSLKSQGVDPDTGRRLDGGYTTNEQEDLIHRLAKAGHEVKAAEKDVAEIRRQSTSELVRNQQEIDDILAKGRDQTDQEKARLAELQKQNIALTEQVKAADQSRAAAEQRKREVQQAKDTRDVNAAQSAFDPAIVKATAAGNDALVAELRMKQQIAGIEVQIAQALRDGNTQRASALEIEKAMVEAAKKASDAKYQRDRAAERAANEAAIRGDKRGAQAIRDAKALEDLQREYVANGLTKEQARADWERSILAEAAGQTPGAVVSSLQAVGGGGGYNASADPMRAAQERVAKATERIGEKLDTLIQVTRGPAG